MVFTQFQTLTGTPTQSVLHVRLLNGNHATREINKKRQEATRESPSTSGASRILTSREIVVNNNKSHKVSGSEEDTTKILVASTLNAEPQET